MVVVGGGDKTAEREYSSSPSFATTPPPFFFTLLTYCFRRNGITGLLRYRVKVKSLVGDVVFGALISKNHSRCSAPGARHPRSTAPVVGFGRLATSCSRFLFINNKYIYIFKFFPFFFPVFTHAFRSVHV